MLINDALRQMKNSNEEIYKIANQLFDIFSFNYVKFGNNDDLTCMYLSQFICKSVVELNEKINKIYELNN